MTLQAPPDTRSGVAPLRVRDVLREARDLFRQNAKAIMLPMAVVQIPLALVGAIVPWVLYATVYSEQLHPFDAQALTDGPRGLLANVPLCARQQQNQRLDDGTVNHSLRERER